MCQRDVESDLARIRILKKMSPVEIYDGLKKELATALSQLSKEDQQGSLIIQLLLARLLKQRPIQKILELQKWEQMKRHPFVLKTLQDYDLGFLRVICASASSFPRKTR